MISKDLRPSANIPRHRRRWGSWSFLGTRWNSRICCWTRNMSLWSISENEVAVSKFISVWVSLLRILAIRLSIHPWSISRQLATSFDRQLIALPIFETQRSISKKGFDHIFSKKILKDLSLGFYIFNNMTLLIFFWRYSLSGNIFFSNNDRPFKKFG